MKKFLSFLLASVMFMTLLPATVFAADETLTVGDGEAYASIQAALDAIDFSSPGIKTVQIKAGTYEETLKIHQKANNVHIVLQGEDGTVFKGKIFIDGYGRSTGNDTVAIRNIMFDYTGKPADYVIVPDKLTSLTSYNYSNAHNITIENCKFVRDDFAYAFYFRNGAHLLFNLKIKDCIFDGFGIGQGNTNGLTIQNVTLNAYYALNIQGGSGSIVLDGVKFHAEGFAVRIGQNAADFSSILITNSIISSSESTTENLDNQNYGAIVLRGYRTGNVSIQSSDIFGHVKYFNTHKNISLTANDVFWGTENPIYGFGSEQLEIADDAGIPHFPTRSETEVKAEADISYMVVIPSSVDFGVINRKMDTQTRPFVVAVEDALIEDGAIIKVENVTASMVMKDKNGTGDQTLAFNLDQPNGLFIFDQADLADGFESITSSVSCEPSELKAAGSYKGYMTFEISYEN